MLFEHASGYALFAVKEVEEIGMLLPQVRPSFIWSAGSLAKMASLGVEVTVCVVAGGGERVEHWEV